MDKKIALVTGANKGLGFETTRLLGKKGLKVYLGARDEKRGQEAAHILRDEGLDVQFLQLDVTSDSSVKAAMEKLGKEAGHLDVLINNAGIYLMGKDAKPSETPVQTIIDTYQVNVFGVARMTAAALPLLKKSKQASVVVVSSGLGSLSLLAKKDPALSFEAIAYNSSKSAVNGIMVAFANEFRDYNIKVNAVNPGYNATDLNGKQGTHPPTHGAAIIVKAAYLDAAGPTATFVDEKADCPW